jgi:hypothetical protein
MRNGQLDPDVRSYFAHRTTVKLRGRQEVRSCREIEWPMYVGGKLLVGKLMQL